MATKAIFKSITGIDREDSTAIVEFKVPVAEIPQLMAESAVIDNEGVTELYMVIGAA